MKIAAKIEGIEGGYLDDDSYYDRLKISYIVNGKIYINFIFRQESFMKKNPQFVSIYVDTKSPEIISLSKLNFSKHLLFALALYFILFVCAERTNLIW